MEEEEEEEEEEKRWRMGRRRAAAGKRKGREGRKRSVKDNALQERETSQTEDKSCSKQAIAEAASMSSYQIIRYSIDFLHEDLFCRTR